MNAEYKGKTRHSEFGECLQPPTKQAELVFTFELSFKTHLIFLFSGGFKKQSDNFTDKQRLDQ